jgi:antitoxin component YwqK of YwqJK toxin-antitoxin module
VLRHIGTYVDGKRQGSFFWHHPNGALQAERRLIVGKQDDPARHFDKRGSLVREEIFRKKDFRSTLSLEGRTRRFTPL